MKYRNGRRRRRRRWVAEILQMGNIYRTKKAEMKVEIASGIDFLKYRSLQTKKEIQVQFAILL